MTSRLIKSQAELVQVNSLLNKNQPPYRKAYSDRTAWLMACLSELAYLRFNPPILTKERIEFIQNNILKGLKKKNKLAIIKWINLFNYDHDEERATLEADLQKLKMDIIATFDCNGTQAILVSNNNFITLAFRGTEAMSIKDIKADINAKTTQCETGGQIHSGFKEAFEEVAPDIQEKLDEDTCKDKPLFITGHSLGGALATIATKKLSHKGGIAACYTFGSPRVGNDEWVASIKDPVFRVVNAADCVTMLPPAFINMIIWVFKFVPYIGKPIGSWLSRFSGYFHCGDMRYLTNCLKGNYENVKLLPAVDFLYRIKGWLVKKHPWKKALSDHSISIYREKLMVIAARRNL